MRFFRVYMAQILSALLRVFYRCTLHLENTPNTFLVISVPAGAGCPAELLWKCAECMKYKSP